MLIELTEVTVVFTAQILRSCVTYLISRRGRGSLYEAHTLVVAGKLVDVSHHELDALHVALAEGSHQTRHLAVVLAVHIRLRLHEVLRHLEVTTCNNNNNNT